MADSESAGFKRIAVAIDGSPLSIKAANRAIHLSKLEGAELIMLHVIEDIKQGGVIGLRARYGDTSLVEAFKNVRKESATEFLTPLVDSAKKEGLKIRSELLDAQGESEASALVKYAEQNNIDLIMLGSRGMSRFERLLVGGFADKVVNVAKCSVLVIR